MAKTRIYELAKDLNTTSKRLMEKLAEINIPVKNHMSFLEEEELKALYKHIGVVKHDEDKISLPEDKKTLTEVQATQKSEPRVKEKKSGPVIIRKTEIFINTNDEPINKQKNQKEGFNKNKPYVSKDTGTSGLRPGFIRDQGINYAKKTEPKMLNNKEIDNKSSDINKVSLDTNNQKREEEVQVKVSNPIIEEIKPEMKQPEIVKTNNERIQPVVTSNNNNISKAPVINNMANRGRVDRNKPFQNRDNISRENNPKVSAEKSSQDKSLQTNNKSSAPEINQNINTVKHEVRKDAPKEREKEKDTKRENRFKGHNEKNNKYRPTTTVLSEKKGISEVLSEDFIFNEFYSDGNKKFKKNIKGKRDKDRNDQPQYIPPKPIILLIKIGESITVKDLAEKLKKTATEVIKKLMVYGVMATLNQEIDYDTAVVIAEEFGVKVEREVVINVEDILFDDGEDNEENLTARPPVVVVMGHVDHGKTSLLDAIRETNVIDKEAGGITQHIGAYRVKVNNRKITFLDTPGHEAFTAMRARGAQVTDIAILVVAADDGIMPQTIEAINHAKAANINIIVAINKMDKPGANPDKVKQELTEFGLVSEEWGGDTICVNISAKKRQNIEQLLEMVLLTADMLELKADYKRQAKGTVIEAKLDRDRGPVATILVQRGTLNIGDSLICGSVIGRIRAMSDDKGNKIKKAGPSVPVEILGLPEVPEAGELFYVITDEKVGKQLIEKRKLKQREKYLKSSSKVSLDDLFNQIKEGKVKDLNIIVKADVQGSVEAIKQSLTKLSNDEVKVNIIHGAVGAITESDVSLAQVSNAIITGFNVRPAVNVMDIAKKEGVDIRLYSVIYKAIEDIEAAMKGMLDPTFQEAIQGHAEIRQTFKVSGIGTIGGSYVTDGKIVRNSEVRVVRDGIVIHEGKLASLKRFKDDAKEVMQGFECGLSLERFNDIKEGDIVECYIMEEVARV